MDVSTWGHITAMVLFERKTEVSLFESVWCQQQMIIFSGFKRKIEKKNFKKHLIEQTAEMYL